MVLPLKLHLPTHHISQNPFPNPNRTPQTPLNPIFRFKPIETHSFPQLHLNLRIKNPNRFKSEESNSNGGSGGGGADDLTKDDNGDRDDDGDGDRDGDVVRRFYLRCFEVLLRLDRENVGALGFPGTIAWVCTQVARLLIVAMMEGFMIITWYVFVGVVGIVSVCGSVCVGYLLWLWYDGL